MKKAIIIGASSGIGKGISIELLKRNYKIGITARRKDKLDEIKIPMPPQDEGSDPFKIDDNLASYFDKPGGDGGDDEDGGDGGNLMLYRI